MNSQPIPTKEKAFPSINTKRKLKSILQRNSCRHMVVSYWMQYQVKIIIARTKIVVKYYNLQSFFVHIKRKEKLINFKVKNMFGFNFVSVLLILKINYRLKQL